MFVATVSADAASIGDQAQRDVTAVESISQKCVNSGSHIVHVFIIPTQLTESNKRGENKFPELRLSPESFISSELSHHTAVIIDPKELVNGMKAGANEIYRGPFRFLLADSRSNEVMIDYWGAGGITMVDIYWARKSDMRVAFLVGDDRESVVNWHSQPVWKVWTCPVFPIVIFTK